MPLIEPSTVLNPPKVSANPLLTRSNNGEVFQFILAFLQMSKGFKLGFVEINFPPDIDELIALLKGNHHCQDLQFVIVQLDDPDLRFLLETLQQKLREIDRQPAKKLVLLLLGLEKSIGTTGDYPPILTNLNHTRNSFLTALPHPTLFLLPEYAVTRIAQFAPDFWAWTSATFKFQAAPATLERVIEQTANRPNINRTYPREEQSERIDLLERLLQEYSEDTEASNRARIEVLNQLGSAHQSIREFETAQAYFHQSLELSRELEYLQGEAIALYHLGDVAYDLRQFQQARSFLEQSLLVTEQTGDRQSTAKIYHQLGIVAQELREYAEARRNYQLALEIYVEFGDRFSQASTYHQLGMVAQELQEYAEARRNYQLALEIYVEFGDPYAQARTYNQLGLLAKAEGNLPEAETNLLQALETFNQFQDSHNGGIAFRSLSHIYATTQSESLLAAMAQILGKTVAEVKGSIEE
jgi:tetratricopeptide (TPR) repeat protein